MVDFVGRRQELATLERELQKVAAGADGERPGRCVMMRGRRRVGKSRLVERFAERSGAPFLFYAATGASPRDDLARLARDAQASTLPLASLVASARPENWDTAFDVLAAALPADRASVLVIDEVPYLMDTDGAFEGMLQRAWDRVLETKPVLLVLIGSDLSMMEALNSYGRPFHQRGREMVLGPLNPAEVGQMLGLDPAEAFDAALVTGGLPLICAEWPRGAGLWDFLGEALSDPVSALLVSAERSLAAEFPPQAQARKVLAAIGSGERTFTNIARAAAWDRSHAAAASTGTAHGQADRRGGAARIAASVEGPPLPGSRSVPAVLAASAGPVHGGDRAGTRRSDLGAHPGELDQLARPGRRASCPGSPGADTARRPAARGPAVGGYWTRTNDVEIDIVGADRAPIAKELLFVGSIKWLEQSAFDRHDLAALHRHRASLTDGPVPVVVVSRSGVGCPGLDATYGPGDLLTAWPL